MSDQIANSDDGFQAWLVNYLDSLTPGVPQGYGYPIGETELGVVQSTAGGGKLQPPHPETEADSTQNTKRPLKTEQLSPKGSIEDFEHGKSLPWNSVHRLKSFREIREELQGRKCVWKKALRTEQLPPKDTNQGSCTREVTSIELSVETQMS